MFDFDTVSILPAQDFVWSIHRFRQPRRRLLHLVMFAQTRADGRAVAHNDEMAQDGG
jgi:hypothetical protein